MMNIKPRNNASINYVMVNRKTVTAPKEIANNFNIYFTKIADNILPEKKCHDKINYIFSVSTNLQIHNFTNFLGNNKT